MPQRTSELIVREHDRHACALDAVLRVDSPGVVLASGATEGGDGGDMLRVRMVDCSAGGAGLETRVFLPRGCAVHMHVFHPPLEGQPPRQGWLLEVPLRIHRTTMVRRDPLYYLGTAFTGLTPAQSDCVRRLLASLAAAAAAPSAPGGAPAC